MFSLFLSPSHCCSTPKMVLLQLGALLFSEIDKAHILLGVSKINDIFDGAIDEYNYDKDFIEEKMLCAFWLIKFN